MRPSLKIWRLMIERLFERQREIVEKYYESISLTPPYSAPVTALLRCYTRVSYDKAFSAYTAVPSGVGAVMGLFFDFSGKVLLEGFPLPSHYKAKTYVDEDGISYTVHAEPDAIVDGEVVELKYTGMNPDSLPLEHHELQLKIYMNIEDMPGRLVYLTPHGVREFYYEKSEALSDEEVARLAREFFVERKSPRYDWECSYCSYRQVCPLVRPRPQQGDAKNEQSQVRA